MGNDPKTMNMQEKSRKQNYLFLIVKIFFTLGAISWFVSTIQLDELIEKLTNINWIVVGFSFLVFLTCIIPCSFRWMLIAKLCGFTISFSTSIRNYIIGIFFDAFLPTGKGGDVVRGVLTSRQYGYSLGGVLTTIFVERFTGLIVALFIVIIACLITLSDIIEFKSVLVSAVILMSCLAGVTIVFFNTVFRKYLNKIIYKLPVKKLREAADDVILVLDICWGNPRVILSAGVLSLINQLIIIVSAYIMAIAIPDFGASWYAFPIVIPLIFISALLPSIGGYGIREAGFVLFFGWFGVNEESAAVFGIFRLFFFWFFSATGAILFVLGKKGKDG